MSRSWFNRLTFSYLPILIIVPAILMILFFIGSAELSKKETAQANEVFSRQAMQSLDYSFRSIGEMMNREIMSGEFDPFFSASENPYLAADEASRRLARLKLTNPLIDSVYVYRLADDAVLSNLSFGRLESFPDRTFLEEVLEEPIPVRWSEPREVAAFGEQPRTVVTLVKGIPLLTGERGLMVVNVSLDSVRELLREMIGQETSFIHLYTADGVLMLGTEPDLPSADAEQLQQEASRSAVESDRELSAVSSAYTEWEIRSGVIGDSLSRILTGIWYVWIGGAAFIVLAGIGWAVFVSRRNYEPVMQLLERLEALPPGTAQAAAALTEAAQISEANRTEKTTEQLGEQTAGERLDRKGRRGQRTDEFARIESTLSAMIARAEADRQRQREDIVYRRRELFRELLEGSRVVDAEEWEIEMLRLELERGFGATVVGILEIDRPDAFNQAYSERSRELFRYALANAAVELAEEHGARLWAEWLPGGRLGLVLRFAKRDAAEADTVSEASDIFQKLVVWVAAYLKCTVTIALGEKLERPEDLAKGFREANEAMGYKSSLGGARVISRKDLRKGAAAELYGVLRTIRELAQAYRLGQPEWKERLEELLAELRKALLPKDDLSGLMNVLAYQLLREMMELPGEAKELWRSEAAPKLSAALDHFDTLDELESTVRSLLDEYAVRLRLLRESRSSHVTLREVRAFIDANFSDPNLSLSLIGDRFELSSSYLSRLFKDAFGENFVDYLASVRIDAAKKLLKETADPIQDIALRVGYANYMSFSRAFKKIASATPGEYRTRSKTELGAE